MLSPNLQLIYELGKATSRLTMVIDKINDGQTNKFLEHHLVTVDRHIQELNRAIAWLDREQRMYFGNMPKYEFYSIIPHYEVHDNNRPDRVP